METEIWKSHPDIPGIEVSTLGRVRTLDRTVSNGKGTRLVKGRVLKPRDNGIGYLQVGIKVNGKQTMKLIHRLVAQNFLPNPDNLPQVNHKDCNPQNNSVKNLEWCDNSYNQKYKNKFGISQTEAAGHPMFAINLSTMEVLHFCAQHEASQKLGVFQSNINSVIKGRYKQTGGFWFVKDDDNADDAINRKLHEIGKTGLKIK
ncbi:NUMOD4 domain-containing protein [Lactobacillus acetotolerans]|uniref:NUMOD4 domain-containing protein n=1 Tax=Lactobacillus acetotolerans TaxID=1600 RepID=UPI002FD8D91D